MGTISEWYRNQTIFLTGGSGYIGKGLLYKLLKIGAKKVYFLIRTKRGQNAEDRLEQILRHEIYQDFWDKDPDLGSKLIAVPGDITQPGLGISEQDLKTLQSYVTVVLHVAASVKFDDPIREAVILNLRSTRDVVTIAKTIENLQILHYVSTAYSNIDQSIKGIEEKVYDRKIDYEKLINYVTTAPTEESNAICLKLLGASTNTYVFTKHLAEVLISDASEYLPVVISRPPIVFSARKEPFPGWMDNVSSPVAVIAASGKGLLRVYPGAKECAKSYVPVDTCVDMILVSTWKEVTQKQSQLDSTPVTCQELRDFGFKVLESVNTYNCMWKPHLTVVQSPEWFWFLYIVLHLPFGILVDTILRLAGSKPRLIKIYRKMFTALRSLYPLSCTNDKFFTGNYKRLIKSIPMEDLQDFSLDVPSQKEFLKIILASDIGWRKMNNEPPYTEADSIRVYWLGWLDFFVQCFFGLLVVYFTPWYLVSNLLQGIADFCTRILDFES